MVSSMTEKIMATNNTQALTILETATNENEEFDHDNCCNLEKLFRELERRLESNLLSPNFLAHKRIEMNGKLSTALVAMISNVAGTWHKSFNINISSSGEFRNAEYEPKTEAASFQEEEGNAPFVLAHTPQTKACIQILRLFFHITTNDPTLSEEMGKDGLHVILSRLVNCDLVLDEEEDMDSLFEIQELACEIGNMNSSSFPMKKSPLCIQEKLDRLPLVFNLFPFSESTVVQMKSSVCYEDAGKKEEYLTPREVSLIIDQVHIRQSDQDDVGYGMFDFKLDKLQITMSPISDALLDSHPLINEG
mmetsp:Transcript_25896/g.26306  ORF Transcript_25896/g.26306 Transcript_25896/m.26306 type:complete len:306 (-) Transcript_25896:2076-2993(-)